MGSGTMDSQLIKDKLRQFYTMQPAIADADRRTAKFGSLGVAEARGARSLLAAAESLEEDADWQLGAIAALQQAAVFAAHGLVARQELGPVSTAAEAWSRLEVLPEVEAGREAVGARAWEQLSTVVESGVTPEHGGWSKDELRSLRQALLEVVRRIVPALEQDVLAPKRLRAKRALRWILSAALLTALVGWGIWSIAQKPNVVNLARGKAVSISSSWKADEFPAASIVDGDTSRLGCHTETQQNPWVQIDLGEPKKIRRVVVTNRLEGLTERAIPLRIEVSTDGVGYNLFAQRDKDFKVWNAKGDPTTTRFVRLTVNANTILHLNEVEVY